MSDVPHDPAGGDEATVPPPVKVATYDRYTDVQAAVDSLSDEGFPVANASIVWRDLRRIEYVTGRRTVISAAGEGGIAGAWFGSLIGLLFAVFADSSDEVSTIGMVGTYLIVGAVAGAAWQAVGHWFRRGARDFSTVPRLDAEFYELWVTPELAGLAADLLGVSIDRPTDPEPAPRQPEPTPLGRAE
jgi:hypothetical protein